MFFFPGVEPSKPPSNLRGHNISSTSILVEWDAVPPVDRNGIITGYRLEYNTSDGETSKQIGGPGTFTEILKGLNEFSVYNICMLAFTVKGDGPESCIVLSTDQDRKFLLC